MKKVALYSSGRPRKPAVTADEPASVAPASADVAPPAAPPGRLRRFCRRFERPLLLAAGAAFAVALVATYAHTRPAPREYTQKDIDAAVLHTLENSTLPSMAAKAFAAIEPSVVKVTGYGVVDPADLEDESEPAKGNKKGERAKESAGKGSAAPNAGRDRLGRNDEGRSKEGDKPSDKPAERGGFHSFPEKEKDKDNKQAAKENPFSHNEKGEKLHSTGIGTGVVIVDKGVILTNLHVVAGAEKIKVRFFEGTEAEAVVIGARPEHDLAVLQAKSIPDDLQAATLRSTADLQVGDQVVAVGFPFGIGPSATGGVVSGLKREYHSPEGKRVLTNLIQFDAAANPGNSGGPLITADGEVVGIVTGILNPTAQRVFIGIGFAVPIENAAAAVGMSPF